jgi:hypothetical protein
MVVVRGPIALTVSIRGGKEYEVAYKAAVRGVIGDLEAQHRGMSRVLGEKAYENLQERIIHREVSPTVGGKTYRPWARMTGRFLPSTFKVRLLNEGRNNEVQGFGFPDVQLADQKTNGAWRALEFGSGPQSEAGVPHIRPRVFVGLPVRQVGLKGAAAGRAGLRSQRQSGQRYPESGPIFQPVTSQTVAGGGSAPKHFLRDAFLEVTAKLPRRYEQIVGRRFSSLRSLR